MAVGALLLLTACDRPRSIQSAEGDEAHFRRGRQALNANRRAEALEAFQKVIDKRQGDAPESHFEVGRIYLEHFKDYVPAIYHFRRYLELRPNGNYASQVGQLIETAKKGFMRDLAGNPFEAQNDRLELIEQRDRLQVEVRQLREQLDRVQRQLQTAQAAPAYPSGNSTASVGNAPSVVPMPSAPTWTNAIPEAAPNVVPINPGATQAQAPPADTGRTYVVQRGDTLVAISRKVYGSASHWRAIYEANRDRIPDPNGLKIGTELRLP